MKMQRGVALLLVVLMLLSCVGSVAEEVAETGSKDPVATASNMGGKTAAPTELTEENRETTVTLSLPSEEYKNKVDVVFVMDKSTSAQDADFNSKVTQLLDSIVQNNTGIELKVGVIKFKGIAENMLGESDTTLLEYVENKAAILSAINADMTKKSSGSNIHSGLVMCNKALEADSEVPDDNKYVILLSDGKSYIWNNDDDVATTYYAQWTKHYAINSSGRPAISQGIGYDKEIATYHYEINNQPPLFFESASTPYYTDSKLYSLLFAVTDNEELLTTSGYYDAKALYAYGGVSSAQGEVTRRTVENPPPHGSNFDPILNYFVTVQSRRERCKKWLPKIQKEN